jgi:hypothetical protein
MLDAAAPLADQRRLDFGFDLADLHRIEAGLDDQIDLAARLRSGLALKEGVGEEDSLS